MLARGIVFIICYLFVAGCTGSNNSINLQLIFFPVIWSLPGRVSRSLIGSFYLFMLMADADEPATGNIVFWMETIMLFLFDFAWLVKGKAAVTEYVC